MKANSCGQARAGLLSGDREGLVVRFVVVAGLFSCVLPVLLRPENYPSDDAHFYLQVAKNIALGHGSTFSRITPTNGYHPLWQLICSGLMFTVKGDAVLGLYLVIVVQLVLFAGILFFIRRLNTYLGLQRWYLVIPILSTYFLCIGLYGSEAHLHGFFLLAVLDSFLRANRVSASPGRWAMVGGLCGLLFLSRLDSVFIIGLLFAVGLWSSRRQGLRQLLWRGLALVAPFLLLAAPYLLLNQIRFGHVVPISGAIKSSFPHVTARLKSLGSIGWVAAVFSAIAGMISARRAMRFEKRIFYGVVGGGSAALCLYVFLFTSHLTNWAWYYVAGVLLFSILSVSFYEIVLTRALGSSASLRFLVSVTVCGALFALGAMRSWSEYRNAEADGWNPLQLQGRTSRKWQIDVAQWLKDNLEPHTNIFIYDWPGIIAYHSDMNVLPVDGLVSDYAYNDRLREVGVVAFLREKHIRYWIGPSGPYPNPEIGYLNTILSGGDQRIDILSPLYKTFAGSFTIANADKVADFRKTIPNPSMEPIGIWRIGQSEKDR